MKENTTEETDDKSLVEVAGDMVGEFAGAADGIPKPIKKGFLKACNQLGTAWLEGKSIEIKATSEARAMMTKGIAEKMLETGKIPEEYTQLAMEQQSRKIVRKRLNLDKILQRTKGFLQNDKEDIVSQTEEISEDWLNSFEDIAENMSSEEMQIRFAKILAGEVKHPSSFSVKSIKMLSEIDTQTANLFARFCGLCVAMKISIRGRADIYQDVRLVAIGGQLGGNSMLKYRMGYENLTRLVEYGLISSDLNSYMPYSNSVARSSSAQGLTPMYYQKKPYILRQKTDKPEQRPELKIHGVALTKAGRELYPVIDMISNEAHFKALQKHFLTQKYEIEPVKIA